MKRLHYSDHVLSALKEGIFVEFRYDIAFNRSVAMFDSLVGCLLRYVLQNFPGQIRIPVMNLQSYMPEIIRSRCHVLFQIIKNPPTKASYVNIGANIIRVR